VKNQPDWNRRRAPLELHFKALMAQPRVSFGISIVGFAAIIASFIWPHIDRGRSMWTEQKALELQRAQSTLHKLGGHEQLASLQGAKTPQSSQEDQEYRDALAAHERLRTELELAQTRGQRISRWLLWGGLAIVMVGWIAARRPSHDRT
jgi:hypothetical protein